MPKTDTTLQHTCFVFELFYSSTSEIFSTNAILRAMHRHPAIAPTYYLNHNDHSQQWTPMCFYTRLKSIYSSIIEYISIVWFTEIQTSMLLTEIGYADFSYSHTFTQNSLNFIDYPDRFRYPVTQIGSLKNIGSYCPTTNGSNTNLTNELIDFISDRPIIYVAFGSMVNWDYAPDRFIASLIAILNALDRYRIIWSYSGKRRLDGVRDHIKLIKWAPQTAILGHSNTILFVGHAGLKR